LKYKLATVGSIACLVFAQVAFAAGRDRLSYTGVEVAFGRVDFANSAEIGDRFELGASLEIASPVFVSGSYTQTKVESTPVPGVFFSSQNTISRVDLGCHFGSDRRVNFAPSISLVQVGVENSGVLAWIPDQTENGWAAGAAFRALATSWLEVDASIRWMFIPDQVIPTGSVVGFLQPLRHFGVGIGYESSESDHTVSARARIVQ